ncbi:uncharacterized protein B0T15DRAFT_496052 [Chaetomium strumarium]|uniref:Rhodopsin domain-containing protein n=1 Tax=Chaetomium strumarium TaxID=1170767 RepID=A0AAJ0GP15_9PEZI|nr:hypothetical protein B0T15DRAFT_496052 [Chaetomium strumarium]
MPSSQGLDGSPSPEYLAQSLAPTIRAVMWVSIAIPLVFVILRCYVRLVIRKVFGLDDALLVISLILLIAFGAVIEAALAKGFGRHVQWVMLEAPQDAISVALLAQVSQPLVIMSCAFGKTSIAVTLLRLAPQHCVKVVLWAVTVIMNVLHILVSILLYYRCKDPRVLWDPSVETTCWPTEVYLYVMYFIGAYSAVTDFILASIPWAVLWKLNMRKREKFGIAFAMSLGIFAGGTAIVKCTKLGANSTSTDPTYDVGTLLLWAGAENGLIIVAACVPTLRPILRAFWRSTVKSSGGEPSHPLDDISNANANNNKNRNSGFFGGGGGGGRRSKSAGGGGPGQWTVMIEAEDQNSDNNSDRSILKQHHHGADLAVVEGADSSSGASSVAGRGVRDDAESGCETTGVESPWSGRIHKTTEVTGTR